MAYELQFNDDLIREWFVVGYRNGLSESRFKELKEAIASQGHAAKGRILQQAVSCSSIQQMEVYIQNNQTAITLAMDSLDNAIQLDVWEIYTIHEGASC
jgi:hypothetical protein